MFKLKEIATNALSAMCGLTPRGPIDIMINK
jgi:hypothetical protein